MINIDSKHFWCILTAGAIIISFFISKNRIIHVQPIFKVYYTTIFIQSFFRRIFYSNLSKVPLEKPLLFVGNHQNSFMDGILVGSYLPQPLHFLMRADMFRKPLSRFFLKELNVAPIYRLEEGMENVHKNLETFTGIYEVLNKNGNIIVFSEGVCVQEKRLQKLRKGTARMAFGAEEKYGLDVHIVPVGINYTYPSSFRKEVMINFHDSFSIKELKDDYLINPAKALLSFNSKVNESLKKEVIIIENSDNDWLAEQLLIMKRNNYLLPLFQWRFNTDDRRMMEKEVCEKINYIGKFASDTLQLLHKNVKEYTETLAVHKLKDQNFSRKLDFGLLRFLAIIIGLPVFLLGYLSNLIPYLIPRYICDKLIKDPRFYSSVYVSAGTVLYMIYLPLIMITTGLVFGWIGFITGLLVPLTGYLVLFYQELFWERLNLIRFKLKSKTNPDLITRLSALRKSIIDELDKIRFTD